jgi:hypothetical protein
LHLQQKEFCFFQNAVALFQISSMTKLISIVPRWQYRPTL